MTSTGSSSDPRGVTSGEPFQVVKLDPEVHCTFFTWHVYVEGLTPGTCYNWRIDGPGDDTAHTGFRFDAHKALVDPWVRAVCDRRWDRRRAEQPGANHDTAIRGIVVDETYDWEDDRPLQRPAEQLIIYELHVGGFTRHASSGVARPGTFAGLAEKIPYLQELGITHVELMPIMAFDAQDVPPGVAALGLKNYWGYSTHSFFAPHPGYCASDRAADQLNGFRDLVKALHRAGIGVILDVVFNHTAEGGAGGPLINFKGFGNEMFYHLDPNDRSRYLDYTGCGNSVNANHPLVARFITECLEYWVREMHVDGFRFDLASALARGEDGKPQYHAPVLWSIEFSDPLAHTRLIAEAWDAGGLYQVGDFPGFRWLEWNGRYRDVLRRFVRGDPGLISELATRLAGSSDLYRAGGRLPVNSINFITSHDGFTLYDQVSYNEKHNHGNGEGNRDGHHDNLSWNCGHEGDTDAAEILALRRRQTRNFVAILLLSHGVPMLLAGDEVLRSQQGNNNAWCQDNELGWFDWTLVETNRDMYVGRLDLEVNGGDVVDFTWEFGDGTSTRGTRVGHAYDETGVYTVRLTIMDNAGASATIRAANASRDRERLWQAAHQIQGAAATCSLPALHEALAALAPADTHLRLIAGGGHRTLQHDPGVLDEAGTIGCRVTETGA